MTRLKTHLISLLACLLAFSCQKEEIAPQPGQVEFVFSPSDASSGGRIKANASSVIISVEKTNGESVYARKHVPLYTFDGQFLSEPVAFNKGTYKLTEFIVLDKNGNAIYAAPLEGSSLAYLVEDPLPLEFTAQHDRTTKVIPEVLKVEGNTAEQFGYATFDFNVVNTFTLPVAIMSYNVSKHNFQLTRGHIRITANGETLYESDLEPITNFLRINDGFEMYTIEVTKPGYLTYKKTFTAESLKEHVSMPLVIVMLTSTLNDGLIAYYPFNGNASDATDNNLDGVVHGAMLTTDRNGHANAAYMFDGMDDHIRVAHHEKLNLSSDFSISLWANIASNQEVENGINDILRKWNGDAQGYPFSISYLNPAADDFQEDRILVARYDGQGCNNVANSRSSLIDNDTFVHILVVNQADKIKTYLNGALIEEVVDPTTCSTANDADMTIGARGNLVRFFKGKIDDIRIYDRALTAEEIASLYAE